MPLTKKPLGGGKKPEGTKTGLLGTTKRKVVAGASGLAVATAVAGGVTGSGPLGGLQQLFGSLTVSVDTSSSNTSSVDTSTKQTNNATNTTTVGAKEEKDNSKHYGDNATINDNSKSVGDVEAGGDANLTF